MQGLNKAHRNDRLVKTRRRKCDDGGSPPDQARLHEEGVRFRTLSALRCALPLSRIPSGSPGGFMCSAAASWKLPWAAFGFGDRCCEVGSKARGISSVVNLKFPPPGWHARSRNFKFENHTRSIDSLVQLLKPKFACPSPRGQLAISWITVSWRTKSIDFRARASEMVGVRR